MEFIRTEIPEVVLIMPRVFADARGYFMETFRSDLFAAQGLPTDFVQDNMSSSVKGTLRGLHYQLAPFSQGKLVRVLRGEVFDVAVDLRRSSPTFGRWVGVRLSEENRLSMFIPEGFAHGFYVLSDKAEFHYKCTRLYAPQAERGIIWNDPDLAVAWPIQDDALILSPKDAANPRFRDAEINF